jgi:hypothetical protein
MAPRSRRRNARGTGVQSITALCFLFANFLPSRGFPSHAALSHARTFPTVCCADYNHRCACPRSCLQPCDRGCVRDRELALRVYELLPSPITHHPSPLVHRSRASSLETSPEGTRDGQESPTSKHVPCGDLGCDGDSSPAKPVSAPDTTAPLPSSEVSACAADARRSGINSCLLSPVSCLLSLLLVARACD